MPELPEVETVVRDLEQAGLVGRRVASVSVLWDRTVASPSTAAFKRRLCATRIDAVQRRGKYIVILLSSNETLLVHLRMSGRLELEPVTLPRHGHTRLALGFTDRSELRFIDQRKFGRWTLTARPEETLGALGPEPLSDRFTSAAFRTLISGRNRMIKPLLLDQHVIAGLGNIYVDEALWDAKLHPCRLSGSLSAAELDPLYRAIRKVLRRGIRCMGTSLGNTDSNFYSVSGRRGRNQDGLRVFRRTGEPCPRCRTPIERLVVAQRSSHVCPSCQVPPQCV